MRLPYVHEAYRAASVGLQVGVAAVLLLWLLRFLEAARLYIEEHLPLKGLWSVVNNAGLFASGLAEWTSPEDALRLFGVNTLGTLRTATAFLPLLRRSKATRILQTAGLRESFAAGWQRLRPEARAAYGPNFADTALRDLLRAQASPTAHSQDTGPVEAAVAHAVLGKWPSARYHPSDVPFLLRTWINTHAPEWLYEALYT
ncbi:Uncharacterized protein GBIM_07282 [Gryllus bimaculatus]|nr:Uncharacterized protein GBIM_07282 [Gryllus bimaculatus]